MLCCGKQIRLTLAELDHLAIEGVRPRIKTWRDYVRAHEQVLKYFSEDTPEAKLLRAIFLEDELRQAKTLARKNGYKEDT